MISTLEFIPVSQARSFQRSSDYLRTPLDHKVADPVVKQDMQGPVANDHVDPISIFPFMALPRCYLEHGENPQQALKRIHGVLASGLLKIYDLESNRWVYPKKSSTEEQTASFLNLVSFEYNKDER